jgi:aminodeoxyfutalosine synthase
MNDGQGFNLVQEAAEAAGLSGILEKVQAGERLSFEEGVALFRCNNLPLVGAMANLVREQKHGDLTYFNRNLHINATNVCEASCIFCSFSRLKTGDPGSYTMRIDEAVGRVKALKNELITEVHIVNGLNPDLPWSYYLDLLRAIKLERPDLHIKGFTAVEIHYFAEKYGKTYTEVLTELVAAGLGSLPGGGAEIFHPRARKKLCDDKVDADGWLQVHRIAHQLGLKSNCTMLFGSIETIEERVDHLLRLRALQDETGGFQTFIPLRFHHENNRLRRLHEPTGADSLKTLAVSRLLLDNLPHIKAYWVMLGLHIAQASLWYGVDDIDGTVREERIYHMAGATTPQEMNRKELIRLIREAGRLPVERDTLYNIVAES